MPNLFRSKRKGMDSGPWKYMDEISGKIISTGTEDEALAKSFMESKGLTVNAVTTASFADLAKALTPSDSNPTPSSNPIQSSPIIPDFTLPSSTIPDAIIPPDTSSKPDKPEKPKPGTFRKNGLSELSPAKIAKFKESLSSIVASGNIDLIRMVFSLMDFETAELDPNGQALLGIGWEAQLEELFVGGLPPAWLILLIANIALTAKLGVSAKRKSDVSVDIRTANGNEPNK